MTTELANRERVRFALGRPWVMVGQPTADCKQPVSYAGGGCRAHGAMLVPAHIRGLLWAQPTLSAAPENLHSYVS